MASLIARAAKSRRLTAGPVTPIDFRGYFVGIGDRKRGVVTATSRSKSNALVEELTWSTAQTTQAQNNAFQLSSAATTIIDNFAADLDNAAYPYECGKLRLLTGEESPAWAKALGGGPLTWNRLDAGDPTTTIPVWFSNTFLDAYEKYVQAIMNYLATKTRKIVDVTVSGCCTVYSEPCITQFSDATNRDTALAAGWTDAIGQAAAKRCMNIHYTYASPLGITSSFAYNPWQTMVRNAADTAWILSNSMDTTVALMEYQKALMGKWGPWENNSIGAFWTTDPSDGTATLEARGGDYLTLYEYMRDQGFNKKHPVYFQTMTVTKMHTTYDPARPTPTAYYAATVGGLSVEMPGPNNPYAGWADDTADPSHVTSSEAVAIQNLFDANYDKLVYVAPPATPNLIRGMKPWGNPLGKTRANMITIYDHPWVGGGGYFQRPDQIIKIGTRPTGGTYDGSQADDYDWTALDLFHSVMVELNLPMSILIIPGTEGNGYPTVWTAGLQSDELVPLVDGAGHLEGETVIAFWSEIAYQKLYTFWTFLVAHISTWTNVLEMRICPPGYGDNAEPWMMGGNANKPQWVSKFTSYRSRNGLPGSTFADLQDAFDVHQDRWIRDMMALIPTNKTVWLSCGDGFQDVNGSVSPSNVNRHPRQKAVIDGIFADFGNRFGIGADGVNPANGIPGDVREMTSSGYTEWQVNAWPTRKIYGQPIAGVNSGPAPLFTLAEQEATLVRWKDYLFSYELYNIDAKDPNQWSIFAKYPPSTWRDTAPFVS